jgi:uncharacterized membrane protein
MSDGKGPHLFRREGTGLEFDRVAFFSDAIYAIAATLIVVGIGVPTIQNTASSKDFIDALSDKDAEIISFFVSFLVLGFFWTAHHRFFSRLAAVDSRLRAWNLIYLMFVAFLPFPTVLIGQNLDNSAAVSFYAISVGAISLLETVMIRHAYNAHLYQKQMPPAVANWATLGSVLPVCWFVLSVPVAFIVGPLAGILTWLLSIPAGIVLNRRAPAEAAQYYN